MRYQQAGRRKLRAFKNNRFAGEGLERRSLLSAITWDGGAGNSDWLFPENWSGNQLPGQDDDVQIGPGFNVELAGVAPSVRSLVSESPLTVRAAGVLEFLQSSETRALLTLAGGLITGSGDLLLTGGMRASGGSILGTGSLFLPAGSDSTIVPQDGFFAVDTILRVGRFTEIAGTLTSYEASRATYLQAVDSVPGQPGMGEARFVINTTGKAIKVRFADLTSSGNAIVENNGELWALALGDMELRNTGLTSANYVGSGYSSGILSTSLNLTFNGDFRVMSGSTLWAGSIWVNPNVLLTIESGVTTEISGAASIRSMSLDAGAQVRLDSDLFLYDYLNLEYGSSLGGNGRIELNQDLTLQHATLWGDAPIIAGGTFSAYNGDNIIGRHLTVGQLNAGITLAGTAKLGAVINNVTYGGSVTVRGRPASSPNVSYLEPAPGPIFAVNVAHPANRVVFGPDASVLIRGGRTTDFSDVPLDNQGKIYVQAGSTLRAQLLNGGVGGSQAALFDILGTFDPMGSVREIHGRWNVYAAGVVAGTGLSTASAVTGDLWLYQPLAMSPTGGTLMISGKLHFAAGASTITIAGGLSISSAATIDLAIDLPTYLDVSGQVALGGIASATNGSGLAFVTRYNSGAPARIVSSSLPIVGEFANQRRLVGVPLRRYMFAINSANGLSVLAIPGIEAPTNIRLTAETDTGVRNDDSITRLARPTLTGSSAPFATITVRLAGTVVSQVNADANGTWTFTPTFDLAQGSSSFTASAADANTFSPDSVAKTIVSDRIAPVVTSVSYLGNVSQSTRFFTSETVASPTTLIATNLTTGQVLTANDFTFSTATQPLSLTAAPRPDSPGSSGLPYAPLRDGNWQLTIPAASMTDVAGNPTATDASASFSVLLGDANYDRKVDFIDLLILAQNFGKVGRNFAQGNFDYSPDGLVDFADLLLLSQRYGMSIPASTSPQRSRTLEMVERVL